MHGPKISLKYLSDQFYFFECGKCEDCSLRKETICLPRGKKQSVGKKWLSI